MLSRNVFRSLHIGGVEIEAVDIRGESFSLLREVIMDGR